MSSTLHGNPTAATVNLAEQFQNDAIAASGFERRASNSFNVEKWMPANLAEGKDNTLGIGLSAFRQTDGERITARFMLHENSGNGTTQVYEVEKQEGKDPIIYLTQIPAGYESPDEPWKYQDANFRIHLPANTPRTRILAIQQPDDESGKCWNGVLDAMFPAGGYNQANDLAKEMSWSVDHATKFVRAMQSCRVTFTGQAPLHDAIPFFAKSK